MWKGGRGRRTAPSRVHAPARPAASFPAWSTPPRMQVPAPTHEKCHSPSGRRCRPPRRRPWWSLNPGPAPPTCPSPCCPWNPAAHPAATEGRKRARRVHQNRSRDRIAVGEAGGCRDRWGGEARATHQQTRSRDGAENSLLHHGRRLSQYQPCGCWQTRMRRETPARGFAELASRAPYPCHGIARRGACCASRPRGCAARPTRKCDRRQSPVGTT